MNRIVGCLIACGMAMAAGCSTGLTQSQVNDLLRDARQAEQWIDKAESFHVRWDTTWEILPQWVEANPGFQLRKARIVREWAFDQNRVGRFNERPDQTWTATRDAATSRPVASESALLNLHARTVSLAWLRNMPHRFWWYNKADLEGQDFQEKAPYRYAGHEVFHGVHCYVLEYRAEGRSLYIGVADHRLRGVRSMAFFDQWTARRQAEIWDDLARENGSKPGDPRRPPDWLKSLPEARQKAIRETYEQRAQALLRVASVSYLGDYREVSPGCFMPTFEEDTAYLSPDETHTYEYTRRTSRVADVQVNQPVPWDRLDAEYSPPATRPAPTTIPLREKD